MLRKSQFSSRARGFEFIPPCLLNKGREMNQIERYYKIDQLLNERGVVSFPAMMVELEISRATLKRDLAYLRDRLNAPIIYDREAGGYRFERDPPRIGIRYDLPGLWFSAEEIHALLTMQHLLANLDTGGLLGPHIKPLLSRLTCAPSILPTTSIMRTKRMFCKSSVLSSAAVSASSARSKPTP